MSLEAASADLLTEPELARRWGLTPRTIKRWRADGKVPPYLPIGQRGGFGQGVRYRLDDVIAFEDAMKKSAQPD